MSSSAISGIGGTVPAVLSPTVAAIQATAQTQAAQTPPGSNGAPPILLIPTKPPLSAAVMAALLGQQTSSYGSAIEDYARNQKQADGAPATGNGPVIPSSRTP
jgi:hypothetical protein